jgi:hypothetical protein
MAVVRAWALGAAVLAIWLLCWWTSQPHPQMVAANENPNDFSAARAEAVLARVLGPEQPHPVGTAENAAVHGRILQELARLHVPAQTYRAFTCNAWRGYSFVACATVTDIVAVVAPGRGKAVVMLAHLDSVPAGPGASDDESGVATILETIRALKAAGGHSLHPVIALFTDGEEAGLLGANAFLENAALRARVGVAVNMEARGTSGPSLLFQTSAGDGRLIDLYAAHVPAKATSSLFAEIYKKLPNDTDLTLFIRDHIPSFNFAFADNVRYYHSPRDLRANLDPATLQMHGENLLGVVQGLEETEFAALDGSNDVYVSVLGRWLPRVPASWALPLSILAFLAIAVAAWLTPRRAVDRREFVLAALMPFALMFGCLVIGFLFAFIAQAISSAPDPTYAYPLAMRIALGLGVWSMALLVSRMANAQAAAAAAWLCLSAFAMMTAALVPGLSPYFLFPALVAAVLLLASAFARQGWGGAMGVAALGFAALAGLLLWLPLVVSGETLMGLKLHELFTLPAAFALMGVVPLLSAQSVSGEGWRTSVGLTLVAAVVAAVIAGLMPPYSQASPQRVNLIYFQNEKPPARWIAETAWKAIGTEPIPASLRRAAPFRFASDAYGGLGLGSGYVAPAGAPSYPLPSGAVEGDRQEGASRILALRFDGSAATDMMMLRIPKAAQLKAMRIRGETVQTSQGWSGDTNVICEGPDCHSLAVTLVVGSRGGFALPYAERRFGLPAFGDRLKAARPATAMPSQSGDGVMLASALAVPAR